MRLSFFFLPMNVEIESSWKQHLGAEFDKQYFVNLTNLVREEYLHYQCFPPGNKIFNAFNLCPFDDVKVVIIGQDPYHEPGQAMGLSFSVPEGVTPPPSLINIFKEIELDLGKPAAKSGDLTRWATQGVLLLNATLTVRAHVANSHQRLGWTTFTDAAIKALICAFGCRLSRSERFKNCTPGMFIMLLRSIELLFIISKLLCIQSGHTAILFGSSTIFPVTLSGR